MARNKTARIAKLYREVPQEQVEKLHQFRANHPYRRALVHGVDWDYIDTNAGERVLLLLTGALGTGESVWQTITHFADRRETNHFRVIAPSYPASIVTMAALTDGLAGLLDAVGVDRADVVGGSAGGWIAQAFVRRHPDRTNRLVISHAGVPKPERGAQLQRALRWLPLLPMGLLRRLAKKRLLALLPRDHPELAFIYAYLVEALTYHVTKESFLATMRRGADLDLNYTFAPGDLDAWPGEVLLIMADDDPSTPPPVRDALQVLYPNARAYVFQGTGHATPILKRDEYLSVMDEFLR
jgi:2-hydroxy-6-oxonona-2,4-dienedioate hydrolase